ncbi:tRNA threonylcarbamoyladenosine biosynthesis protein TsaB, partial [Enterococcus faecalis]|uniref:tRNA threonylcarbamoyladenosine biosynthesis protein TsaB n=1 Tax=Enterococcus faecalis TaxID=1351 RepID=UPI003CC592F8
VAEGPGTYTGLRLGVTSAKSLAYTLKKELVGFSCLQTLAANCVGQTGVILPLFDALRKNVNAGADRFVNVVWQNELP